MSRHGSHQNRISHEEAMSAGSYEMLRRLWISHPRIMENLRAVHPFQIHVQGETL